MIHKLVHRAFISQNQRTFPFIHTSVQNRLRLNKNVEQSRVCNVKKSMFQKYINYINLNKQALQNKYPKIINMYHIISMGTTNLVTDMKNYLFTIKKQFTEGTSSLTVEELKLIYTIPNDLTRLVPVLFISIIPFATIIVIPLAISFSTYFLPPHYWTLQQKTDYMLLDLKKRSVYKKKLFKCLQAEVDNIKNVILKIKWKRIIACLGSGKQPDVEDIIACSALFSDDPYEIRCLKQEHKTNLLGIYGISSWSYFKISNLIERGSIIKYMDQAIQKEGGVIKLSVDELFWALSFRGINPRNMSLNNMRNYLEKWLVISNSVDENTMSLLLHSPILLGCNYEHCDDTLTK